ncbi:lipopolysaccharide export system permease protein [Elusimicrobium posterum]|uniref:LptF/LptG family permease n=1 Tax=Elusimicrobium posterum TaxID=3116653 RepID=UPI003C774F3A
MKIIYGYIAKKFWMPFFFSLGIFSVLVIFGDVFDNLRSITNGYATFRLILKYALLNLPGWFGMLLPVACLMGSLFVISDMVSGGEWTACVASGYRPLQLFMPLVACVVFIMILNLAAQEFVIPDISKKASTVFNIQLRGKKGFDPAMESNINLRIGDNKMLFAQQAKSGGSRMDGITIDIYNDNWEIATQLVAKSMEWDGGHWMLMDGVKRDFVKGINIEETVFTKLVSPLEIDPKNIVFGDSDEKSLSSRDLYKRIKFLGASGLQTYKEKTNLYNRLAMPVIAVLMCLLCMPFAITVRKKNKAVNIIAALVVTFIVWWIMSMGVTAGENGALSPLVAGWGVVFIAAAIVVVEFKIMKI